MISSLACAHMALRQLRQIPTASASPRPWCFHGARPPQDDSEPQFARCRSCGDGLSPLGITAKSASRAVFGTALGQVAG
jgi:hypothetical protein